MKSGNTDSLRLAVHFNVDPPVQADRLIILGDLVSLRRIGIEIVLTVELADVADCAVQRHGCFHGIIHRLAVQNRQDAWMAQADRAGMGIGRRSEFRGAAAEYLRLGMKLDVNFKTDDGFVLG
ncbi:hypothetical protein D3C71_1796600 [compost metagenome]